VFELAPQLTGLRLKPEVDLTLEDLKRAQEILLIGTTLDVTPVTRFEERVLIRGPWSEKLRDLIRTDQLRS
jgi:branched-subunit amino acid aminotransferase/4-amino-4-deoxychorismate lyase